MCMQVQRVSYNVNVRPQQRQTRNYPTFTGGRLTALEKRVPEIEAVIKKIKPVVEKYEPKDKEIMSFLQYGRWGKTGLADINGSEEFSEKHLTPVAKIRQNWLEKLGLSKPAEYIENIRTVYYKLTQDMATILNKDPDVEERMVADAVSSDALIRIVAMSCVNL